MKKLAATFALVAWSVFAFSAGWFGRTIAIEPTARLNDSVSPILEAQPPARATANTPAVQTPRPQPARAPFAISTPNAAYGKRAANAQPMLEEAWGRVRESFVGELPNDQQRDAAAIAGALELLGDKYTVYLPPTNRSAEREHYAGRFGGIGVNINGLPDGRSALAPIKNTPAERAGVMKGDILISIDDWQAPPGTGFNDIALRVRGNPGTTVRIGVLRGSAALEFKLVREFIDTPSVEWHLIADGDKTRVQVGYVRVSSFTERTGSEARQAISELQSAGAQAWLLDLRDNGGGLLASATEVASQFLKDGVVLIEAKRSGENTWPVTKGGLLADNAQPLVVLVNNRTASASEIVAGALQDYKRGMIIGERTHGKGVVQLLYDLSDGSSVHVTSARWYTPNRRTIDGVGVLPDIELVRTTADIQNNIDSQLDRALRLINEPVRHLDTDPQPFR